MLISLAYALGDAGGKSQQGGADYSFFLMMAAMVAIFYFLLIRPQQKQRKLHQQFLDSLKKGDMVVTSAGIYGKVVAIMENSVLLEIADKVQVKIRKGHIVQSATPAKEGQVVKKEE